MKNWWHLPLLLLLLGSTDQLGFAQTEMIVLRNPSFEDMPRHSSPPRYWTDCGFDNESPPDIQPDFTFQVSKLAQDGNTYLGMVVRDNDTWESVGQQLARPLQGGKCYSFSMQLARSLSYMSVSRERNEPANYITPTKLRIWGGYGLCDKRNLLGESPIVKHNDWRQYDFKLEPDANYTHIVFEVFYNTPTLFPYNGNLLVDNASVLQVIPCDEDPSSEPPTDPVVVNEPEPVITPVDTQARGGQTPPPPPKPAVKGSERVFGKKEIAAGLRVPIENADFPANSAELTEETQEALENLYLFLEDNPNVIVEIGGHTNALADRYYADRLIRRSGGKAVAHYLTAQRHPTFTGAA
jgi:outer membrane protein OmpA-like peptidoglycan-associated protein